MDTQGRRGRGAGDRYFVEVQPLVTPDGRPEVARIAEVASRYGMAFDMEGFMQLLEERGLHM